MNLTTLSRQTGLLILALIWLAVPLVLMLAWQAKAPMLMAGGLVVLCAGATSVAAMRGLGSDIYRATCAVALMLAISLVVWLVPDRLRADVHMAYFAALALLVGFRDPWSILLAAGAVAVHHIGLGMMLPSAVFPDANGVIARIAMHAGILVVEAGALAWSAHTLGVVSNTAEAALAGVETARGKQAEEAELRAKAEQTAAAQATTVRSGLAGTLEERVGGIAGTLGGVGKDLKNAARELTMTSDLASRSAKVASEAANATVSDVQSVAAASEELAVSVAEITRQVSESAEVARVAVTRTKATDASVKSLNEAAEKIGQVVRLIEDIASKTNLLALNATIEAARAGDAGKGFAVVAGEVKALAGQTAKATAEIGEQVSAIQQATSEAVTTIRDIGEVIGQVERTTDGIAHAVDQQARATQEIAGAAARVASGTETASKEANRAGEAAAATAKAVANLDGMADNLVSQASALQVEVGSTVKSLRA